MNSLEGQGKQVAEHEGSTLSPAKRIDTRIKLIPEEWIPGTAIAYTGEPVAEEYALLRFGLKPAERRALPDMVARELEENRALYDQGDEAVEAFCARIATLMVEQGRATPIIEDFGDPLEPLEPTDVGNGNGHRP